MESIAKLIVIIGLGYLLMTCSTTHHASSTKSRAAERSQLMDQHPSVRFTQLKRVGRAVNADGQPMAYILLGSEDGGLLDIYLVRSAIRSPEVLQNHGFEPSPLEVRAHWKGRRFSQSQTYPTSVTLKIETLTADEAVIEVSATLAHTVSGAYLEITSSKVRITGEQLNELTGGDNT